MANKKFLDYVKPMTISISAEDSLRDAIDNRAFSLGKSRSEYMRDLAIEDLVKVGEWVDVRAQ